MKNLKTSIKALLAATILALPSQLLAQVELNPGNGHFGTFVSAITGGKLVMGGYFDQGQAGLLRIVGASILVQGESGGNLVVKEIEYTNDGSLRVPALWRILLSSNPKGAGLGVDFLPLPSPMACTGNNEPILAVGNEYNYSIQWCNNNSPTNFTNSAKKNYYYMFANGDYQLVLTLEYDCHNPADIALMPPPVIVGACTS